MKCPVVCFLTWFFCSQLLHAQYQVEGLVDAGGQNVVYAGSRVRLSLVLVASSDERHNACAIRLECSRPGLVLESYFWEAPYENLAESDDSIPPYASLPQSLDVGTLTGPAYPPDVVDFQLSNVLPGTGIFRSGKLLELTFRVPDAFPLGPLVLTPVVDGISNGFDFVPVSLIQPLALNIESPPAGFNTPPTLSELGDIRIQEDTPWPGVFFTIDDDEQLPEALSVDVHSSDASLVRDEDIVLDGIGSSRSMRFVPVANAVGEVTLTVTVSDGVDSVQRSFLVGITEVNDPPKIGHLQDQVFLDPPAWLEIPVVIEDPDSPADAISLYVETDHPELIPYDGIQIQQTDTGHLLRLKPTSDTSGDSLITLTVSDGKLIDRHSFKVTIRRSNRAPIIGHLEDLVLDEDGVLRHAFFVSDDLSAFDAIAVEVQHLVPDLLSEGGLMLQRVEAGQFELTIRPNPNAHGSGVIKVIASDGLLQTSSDIQLTVHPVNDAPTLVMVDQIRSKANQTIIVQMTLDDLDDTEESLLLHAVSSDQGILSDSQMTFEGVGESRQLYIRPNKDATGRVQVSVTVTDPAGGRHTATLLVDMIQDDQEVQTWDTWKEWVQIHPLPETLNAPEQDADNDGVPNWLEMVFASDPLSTGSRGLPSLKIDPERPISTPPVLEFVLDQRLEGMVQVSVRAVSNLQSGEFIPLEELTEDLGNGLKRVRLSFRPDQATGKAFFFLIETQLRP